VNYPSPHKEVRYIVCRLVDPGDPEGEREKVSSHRSLDLAMNHANRTGPDAAVDAEGGTFYPSGPYGQSGRWDVEWINRNLYRGKWRKTVS
jgi:hypothetical protein